MKKVLRIAVADDETEVLTNHCEALLELGHRVVVAARNGRELLNGCREARPDLVITDIKMPKMDGIDAAQEICRKKAVPVILVSAYHDPELLDRAESDPFMAYLIKPIKSSDLDAAIRIAAHRFERHQALEQEAGELKQALEDRKIIERAKGILMKQTNLDEPEAFRRLQRIANNQNRKLVEIAETIVTTGMAFEPDA